ncbi:MAG: transcription antitermination protein NusB [Alphaproteobacteria bacterium]|nr:transcription antitermination protein NusB [Alphaproteobacteria bacterium]
MNNISFYEANYGDSRFVLYQIFKKFFDEKSASPISEIFNEVINQNSQEKTLSIEEYLNQIDDDFLSQVMIGMVDNLDQINQIIESTNEKNLTFEEQIILKLIIFELKFLSENSVQSIFEEYKKICKNNSIKYPQNLVIELIKKLREFEF